MWLLRDFYHRVDGTRFYAEPEFLRLLYIPGVTSPNSVSPRAKNYSEGSHPGEAPTVGDKFSCPLRLS